MLCNHSITSMVFGVNALFHGGLHISTIKFSILVHPVHHSKIIKNLVFYFFSLIFIPKQSIKNDTLLSHSIKMGVLFIVKFVSNLWHIKCGTHILHKFYLSWHTRFIIYQKNHQKLIILDIKCVVFDTLGLSFIKKIIKS